MDPNSKSEIMNKFSRQISAFGIQTMQKICQLSVMILGAKGVGQEVGKTLALMGIKRITFVDDGKLVLEDLQTVYYAGEKHLEQRRAYLASKFVQKLNRDCTVDEWAGDMTEGLLQQYNCLVVTQNMGLAALINLNEKCRKVSTKFLLAVSDGLSGYMFTDFIHHKVIDPLERPPQLLNIVRSLNYICDTDDPSEECNLLIETESNVDFCCGDFVSIDDAGIAADSPTEVIETISATKFIVAGREKLSQPKYGGTVQQVIKQFDIAFQSLKQFVETPNLPNGSFNHFDRNKMFEGKGNQLHFGRIAILKFVEEHSRLPQYFDEGDAAQVYRLASQYAKDYLHDEGSEEADEQIIRMLSFLCGTELPGLTSFIGGMAAHEVLKLSGKYTPLSEGFYHIDYFDLLEKLVRHEQVSSRYSHQIAIFGQAVQEEMEKSRIFLVGAGALGCEYLKNFLQIGFGSLQQGGEVLVTDMDHIELSNLTRQFLFSEADLHKSKSLVAAEKIKKMNANMNVTPFVAAVGDDRPPFDRLFWKSLSFVVTALDSVDARAFVDSKIVLHGIPMLESGTEGTKGSCEIIYPHKTRCYRDYPIQKQDIVPSCTLKLFPSTKLHCIQWARMKFEEYFVKIPKMLNNLPKGSHSQSNCSPDYVQNGAPFWYGSKKFPTPVQIQSSDEELINYILFSANIFAQVFGLTSISRAAFEKSSRAIYERLVLSGNTSTKIGISTDQLPQMEDKIELLVRQCKDMLVVPQIQPVVFEKDDDSNFHVDFMTYAANLRARAYHISPTTRFEAKIISGKIIPALASTTTVITGLNMMEVYKLFTNKSNAAFKQITALLNTGNTSFRNSPPPIVKKGYFDECLQLPVAYFPPNTTCWDKISIKCNRDTSLEQFLDDFKVEFKLTVQQLVYLQKNIYSIWLDEPPYHKSVTLCEIANLMEVSELVLQAECEDDKNALVAISSIEVYFN